MVEQKPDKDIYTLEDIKGKVVEEVSFKSFYFLMRARWSNFSSKPVRECVGRFNGYTVGQWIRMRDSYAERVLAESNHLTSVGKIMEYLESQKWSL